MLHNAVQLLCLHSFQAVHFEQIVLERRTVNKTQRDLHIHML